jgi:hypothetical protein
VNILPCYVNILPCYVNILPCYVNILPCYVNILPCYVNILPCYPQTSTLSLSRNGGEVFEGLFGPEGQEQALK